MSEKIGLFGGSFNPVHHGHLIVARAIREHLALDRLIFVPAAQPPHKEAEHLAEPQDRLAMVRLAIAGEQGLDVSDCELSRAGPSYTIDTVAAFREMFGLDAIIYWIIGADSLAELTTWHRVSALVEACTIITACRPGWDVSALETLRARLTDEQIARLASGVVSTPLIEVSSTQIRRRVASGKSIRYLLPEQVRRYIEEKGLYKR